MGNLLPLFFADLDDGLGGVVIGSSTNGPRKMADEELGQVYGGAVGICCAECHGHVGGGRMFHLHLYLIGFKIWGESLCAISRRE